MPTLRLTPERASEMLNSGNYIPEIRDALADWLAMHEELLREAPPAGEVCDLAREVMDLDKVATPGPWRSKDRRLPVGYEVVVLSHNTLICDIALQPDFGPTPDADFIANSRTAAPALARAVLAQAAALADKDAEIARLLDAVQMVYERQSRPRQREVDLQALELLLYAGGRIESPVDAP